MARFKRLTDTEARTLTRGEMVTRIEAEQQYWFRKNNRTAEDDAGFREFTRIMHAYLSPASLGEAMQDTIDYIEGRSPGSTGKAWPRRERNLRLVSKRHPVSKSRVPDPRPGRGFWRVGKGAWAAGPA